MIDQILCDSQQNIDFRILKIGTAHLAASLVCSKDNGSQHMKL